MGLTPPQWERVKALFEEALEKPPAERASFLTDVAQDPVVRTEVERLLDHHVESGGFLSLRGLPHSSLPAWTESSQSLAPGDVVASRFRIVRFLAQGGMGEVYEAEDLELRERVALKSIRSELLHDEKSLERFKREVHLARQVTHPNVCRIYELFRHSPAHSEFKKGSEVVLVAMELLEGETLTAFLSRSPRPPIEDVLSIALQMAAGLGAAHAAEILHRDFKPSNVHLVPRAQGMRVVITDFGLALRSNRDLTISGSVTGTGEILGTPAYMSPEQVEGKELTPSSDVYSLGLVLYQMMTGTRAFEAPTPLATAVMRLKVNPTPPRALIPNVDRRWESVILNCLERDPKSRYQNGDEVGEALRGETKNLALWRKPGILGIIGIALVTLFVGGIILLPKLRQNTVLQEIASTRPPIAIRRSIAVLPLRNLSGNAEKDWVSTALPELLTAELAAGGKMRTFPGENIARASSDLKLTGMQTLARDTLDRLWKYLGSDYVVLGSYLDQGSNAGGQVRVDLWLQDARTGEITATISEKGPESELDDLATRAGATLRERLGVGDVTPDEAALVRASLPSNPEAQRLYSEGLAKLRVVDVLAARDLLERAVSADPGFALGHSALADAWAVMGYDHKAQEESKKALQLSSGLSREERLSIEGNDWELNRNWDKAVDIYRTLFEFFPDNIEYGLRLSTEQRQARTVDDALATLGALRKLPAPSGEDPRISLQQADVFDVKGAYAREQAAAETATSRARELGETLLLARALIQEARTLEKLGKLDDAVRIAREAASISEAAGERAESAKALSIIGIVNFDRGNFPEAVKAYNTVLATQRESGDMRGTATTLNNLANALGAQGDLAGSIKMLNESLLMFREVGDKHSTAAVLGDLAARTLQQGDLMSGKKMLEEGLAASREIGDDERTSTALYNLGEVLRWQGDLKGARAMYQQAGDLSKQIGDQSGVAYAMFSLGDVSTAEGDLIAARARYSDSLKLRTQMGEQGNAAETQMAMALLSIEAGNAREAASTLNQVRGEFHKEGLADDEILADTLLARILLSEGKVAEAEKETASAHELLTNSQDFSVRLRAMIGAARVQAASGKTDEAFRTLDDVIASAKKSGYAGYLLEAQLVLGSIEATTGEVNSGMALLRNVRKQAQLEGFHLIAKKAAQSSAKPVSPEQR